MRVIHLLNTGAYSGEENVAITIISSIKKMNSDIEFFYCSPKGVIEDICQENSINFIGISNLCKSELNKVIKSYRPDIIHAHDFTALFVASRFKKKCKIIGHLHNNPFWLRKINCKSLVFLLSARRVNKLYFVSNSITDEFVFSKLIKNSEIIGNPINYRKIKDYLSYDKKNRILFIGRLTEQKDPIRFLSLIRKLKEKNINVEAAMIGDGELRNECNNYIAIHKLDVKMMGFINNPYPYIATSKITLMTSKWEGYGLVAIESLTLGVPVVATSVGGIPSYLTNDIGYLYENDNEALEELFKLLKDSTYYSEKSNNAIAYCNKKFNNNIYFEKMHRDYYELIKG